MAPRRVARFVFVGVALALGALPESALAHGGGLAGTQPERLAVPTWLFLMTGGGVIGASFLLASFVTDRDFLAYLHERRRALSLPEDGLARVGRLIGVAGLAVVVVAGLFGPATPLENAAILLVWAGWWAGYVMTLYLVGHSWPALNPFRTLARPLGEGRLDYPDWLGSWPAVAGLLALIWLEVVSPLADDPRFLAAAAVAYLAVSLLGSAAVGVGEWFEHVDPLSAVFRQYGRVAPIQRRGENLALTLPGNGLLDETPRDLSAVGLVVAIVWGTTYDGFVQTPLWTAIATPLVEGGIAPMVLYPAVLGVGFLIFLGVFLLAARSTRRFAPTYLSTGAIARLFAPSLLAIAAGYHLAHYLSYFLTLAPALVGALATPLQSFSPVTLSVPGWMGALSIVFVLLGHVLAIWVAHGIAYRQFPGRLQAIRSQYPITVVMVLYTMASLWIVTQPFTAPPYL